jgi:putative ABC transport system ATP-binding protein
MIELQAVSKAYGEKSAGGRVILDQCNWSVSKGDFIALVGRSGCGKTTVLNLIGGLSKPDIGVLHVNGINTTELSDRDLAYFRNRNLGFVFQHFFLRPRRTAADNVTVPLLFGEKVPSNLRQMAVEALDLVGLADMADRPVGLLSGGQRQRVAIARALISKPLLLLADEPTGNLDVDTGTALFDLLQILRKEMSMTILLVTHDPLVERFGIPLFTVAHQRVCPVPQGIGLSQLDSIHAELVL